MTQRSAAHSAHSAKAKAANSAVSSSELDTESGGPWWVFAVPVSLLTALLALINLNHQLWDDEYITDYVTKLSTHQFAHLVLRDIDAVHALYYVGIRAWTGVFGDSTIALRIPSVIGVTVAAGAVTVLGQRLLNRSAGLTAGLIFALLPSVSDYGQWARSYAWVIAIAALDTLLLLSVLRRPSTRRWVYYGALTLMLIYLHMAAAMVLLPHAVLLITAWRREGGPILRHWLYTVAGVSVLTVPLLAVASRQTAQVAGIRSVNWAQFKTYERWLFGSTTVTLLVVALAIVGAIRLWRNQRETAAVLLVWALAPSVLSYLTVRYLHMFNGPYQLFTLPAWTMLAASALIPIPLSNLQWHRKVQFAGAFALALVVGVAGLAAQRSDRRSPYPAQPDFKAVAAYLDRYAKAGDGVVYAGHSWPDGRMGVAYFLKSAHLDDLFVALPSEQNGGFGPALCTDAVACLGVSERVWLVAAADTAGEDDYSGMPSDEANALKQLYTLGANQSFANIRVALLTRR